MEKSKGEEGFILVLCMLVLVVLSIIGIASMKNTGVELQISGNENIHRNTFYAAEGGTMFGSSLLEQNFSCPTGFTSDVINGKIAVKDKLLYSNATLGPTTIVAKLDDPVNQYDVAYYLTTAGVLPDQNVGYLYFGGETTVLPGGALQMAAGYEGKGKSVGQGGAAKFLDIYSQYKGLRNSESIILFGWRHMIGTEGSNCIF